MPARASASPNAADCAVVRYRIPIADHAQVVAVTEPPVQQSGLRGRDVLELVDEEVAEPPALGDGELGVSLERIGAQPDQVVEVDESLAPLLALVPRVQVGHFGRG